MKKAVKQSTISNALSIATITLTVVLVLIGIRLDRFSGEAHAAEIERHKLTAAAEEFIDASAYLVESVRNYAASMNTLYLDGFFSELYEQKSREACIKAMMEIGLSQQEYDIVVKKKELSDFLVDVEMKALENIKAGNIAEASASIYAEDYENSILQLNEHKTSFLGAVEERIGKRIADIEEKKRLYEYTFAFLFVIVVLIQVAYIFVFRSRFIRPLMKIRDQITDISKSWLDSDFELSPDTSELGLVINAIGQTKKSLKDYKDNLEKLAFTDTVTGLPNLQYLLYKIEDLRMTADTEHVKISSLAIDIKRFSDINDSVGFVKGNAILLHVGDKIKTVIGDGILVRASADKFFIVFWNGDETFINNLPRKFQQLFSEPQTVEDIQMPISFRFGIAKDETSSASVAKNIDRCRDCA